MDDRQLRSVTGRLTVFALLLLLTTTVPGCGRRAPTVETPTFVGSSEIEVLRPQSEPSIRVESEQRPPPEGAPATLQQDSPVYPESAIEARVTCAARLLYHIETDGTASVARIDWDVAPPEPHAPAFEATIHDAVATWRFQPAFQQVFRELPDGSYRFEKKPIPKAVTAVIRFRVVDGVPIVD